MPLKRGIIGRCVSTKQDRKQRCQTEGAKEQRLQNETIERMQTLVVESKKKKRKKKLVGETKLMASSSGLVLFSFHCRGGDV